METSQAERTESDPAGSRNHALTPLRAHRLIPAMAKSSDANTSPAAVSSVRRALII